MLSGATSGCALVGGTAVLGYTAVGTKVREWIHRSDTSTSPRALDERRRRQRSAVVLVTQDNDLVGVELRRRAPRGTSSLAAAALGWW